MGRYQEALDYIFGYVNYERQARYAYDAVTFNLGRMVELLNRLDRPQDKFSCVHIAGTKGKGSTSAMVESVLRAAGHRTGLYTSPHLHTFRERIRVDGGLMPKADLVDVVMQTKPAIEAVPGITAFEIMTALGFVYFAERQVEWAVLEVGLGGRLDATNVVRPAVCGITPLSFDHVELLGHTLSLIAWEKAGIIKSGVPLVSAPQEPEAMAVIEQVCADIGARLVLVGRDWSFEVEDPVPFGAESPADDAGLHRALCEGGNNDGSDGDARSRGSRALRGGGDVLSRQANMTGQSLTVRRGTSSTGKPSPGYADNLVLRDLRIPLMGHHQLVNATTAVAILAELNTQGVTITEEALRTGLATTRWPGRFEVLLREPVVVVDSAHNGDSASKLRATIAECFPPVVSYQPSATLAPALRSGASAGVSHQPSATQSANLPTFQSTNPRGRRLVLVFGASADKDIAGMLEVFLGANPDPVEDPVQPAPTGLQGGIGAAVAKVVVTRSGHPRSADPQTLAEQVRVLKPDCPVSAYDDVGSALYDAVNWAGPDDIICVTGSIFVVAQARRAWALRHPEAFLADDWVYQDETAGQVVPDDNPAINPARSTFTQVLEHPREGTA